MAGSPIVLCSPLSYHHNRHSFALALQRVSATRVIANSCVVKVLLNSLQFERYIYFAMLHLYKHHVVRQSLAPSSS